MVKLPRGEFPKSVIRETEGTVPDFLGCSWGPPRRGPITMHRRVHSINLRSPSEKTRGG